MNALSGNRGVRKKYVIQVCEHNIKYANYPASNDIEKQHVNLLAV